MMRQGREQRDPYNASQHKSYAHPELPVISDDLVAGGYIKNCAIVTE